MKILHVTRDFPPRVRGGISTAVGGLVRALQTHGCSALVISFDDYRPKSKQVDSPVELLCESQGDGISVVRIHSPAGLEQGNSIAMEFDADLVHVHHEMLWEFSQGIANAFLATAPSKKSIPTVYSVHVLQSKQNRLRSVENTQSSIAQTRALREANIIHAPSKAVATLLREEVSDTTRIRVIRLGTEFSLFNARTGPSNTEAANSHWADQESGDDTRKEGGDDTRKEGDDTRKESGDDTRKEGGDDTRKESGDDTRKEGGDDTRKEGGDGETDQGNAEPIIRLSNASPQLLYVGRFADINGISDLLDALPVIFARHPNLRAIAAGGLPSNPRGARRWEKRWRNQAGDLADRLEFVGWQSKTELQKLYRQSSMLIVPSWFETFGQVALEGMLHGIPIITTRGGALPELLDETCAHVIDPQSPTSIADAVDTLLANPQETECKQRLAFRRATDEYNWQTKAADFLALYSSLTSQASQND